MSELSVGQLRGLTVNQNIITVPTGHTLYAPGSLLQVQKTRTDSRSTYGISNSVNGTALTPLALQITPKFSNSLLLFNWSINAEAINNGVFLIQKNGSVITTLGETGYNAESGNVNWSGIAPFEYDNNDDSTPNNYSLQYFCQSSSTSTQTFTPAVRLSYATSSTFYLNRTFGSAGSDYYETMVSFGTVMEIAQ